MGSVWVEWREGEQDSWSVGALGSVYLKKRSALWSWTEVGRGETGCSVETCRADEKVEAMRRIGLDDSFLRHCDIRLATGRLREQNTIGVYDSVRPLCPQRFVAYSGFLMHVSMIVWMYPLEVSGIQRNMGWLTNPSAVCHIEGLAVSRGLVGLSLIHADSAS